MNTSDRDLMIRFALTPPAEVHAPADLGDSIYREIVRTPQRRGLVRLGGSAGCRLRRPCW